MRPGAAAGAARRPVRAGGRVGGGSTGCWCAAGSRPRTRRRSRGAGSGCRGCWPRAVCRTPVFSAGAAVAARRAVVGGWLVDGVPVCPDETGEDLDEVEVRAGLGLVPFAVDVHAAQWGTLPRLVSAVARGEVPYGVAVDENTLLTVGRRRGPGVRGPDGFTSYGPRRTGTCWCGRTAPARASSCARGGARKGTRGTARTRTTPRTRQNPHPADDPPQAAAQQAAAPAGLRPDRTTAQRDHGPARPRPGGPQVRSWRCR